MGKVKWRRPYLIVGEDSEYVQLRVGGKALALPHAGDDPCHKGAMAQPCVHMKGVGTPALPTLIMLYSLASSGIT